MFKLTDSPKPPHNAKLLSTFAPPNDQKDKFGKCESPADLHSSPLDWADIVGEEWLWNKDKRLKFSRPI